MENSHFLGRDLNFLAENSGFDEQNSHFLGENSGFFAKNSGLKGKNLYFCDENSAFSKDKKWVQTPKKIASS